MGHPANDFLSRSLARHLISRDAYDAGRRLQSVYRDADGGDENAKAIEDSLALSLKWSQNLERRALLRAVLGHIGDDPAGLPSPLAQAAVSLGLKSLTSSWDMRKLARELRQTLVELAETFRLMDAAPTPRQSRPSGSAEDVSQLGGVGVFSVSTTDDERLFERVQRLVLAKGLMVCRNDRGFDVRWPNGRLAAITSRGGVYKLYNLSLNDIQRSLSILPAPKPKRKRGGFSRAPVTLAKHA
jgi:hypothetical protein